MSRLIHKLKSWLPTPEAVMRQRWLRWLAPFMGHPRLWHFTRKGVALGVTLGIFFGLLIPVAQIPAATGLAIVLRANVPAAVASTFVSNPLTFGPIYYAAYRLGRAVLPDSGSAPASASAPAPEEDRILDGMAQAQQSADERITLRERIMRWRQQLSRVGKPLIVGLAIIATVSGIAVYFISHLLWRLRVRWNRRTRSRERAASESGPPGP